MEGIEKKIESAGNNHTLNLQKNGTGTGQPLVPDVLSHTDFRIPVSRQLIGVDQGNRHIRTFHLKQCEIRRNIVRRRMDANLKEIASRTLGQIDDRTSSSVPASRRS